VREFLAQALEDDGYRVLQAFNGRHALRVISNAGPDGPDLIISDVMMPLVGGVELCPAVKGNPEAASIPVLLMSAAVQQANLKNNADGFIAKPFDLDTIDAVINSVLSGQQPKPG
jgi:DNA-binding response OmpR family regulator